MPSKLNTTEPLKNISTDTLTRAFEDARNPLIITDYNQPDNPIVYSNQAFLDMTGYDMEEVLGRNCRFLQGDDTDQSVITELRQAVKNSEYVRVTIKNYKKDKTPFWNDLVMSPLHDESGKTTHFLGMQLDVTDRIMAEERLSAKTSELEQSNKELEQFTYATSHDLQEPLRMISSYLQLIHKRYSQVLDADGKTFLNFASEGAERLQGLIYDLLTLSKVTSSNDKFKLINLAKPLEQARFNLKLSIEETDAVIEADDLPEVEVDPAQMAQLFQNLLGNAIKYRREGIPPHIKVTAIRKGKRYDISVIDNGIGIDKQYFDRIFAVFQRLHTRNEYSGSGIGLAICTRIIERHNGRIWVESTKGKGTTFTFTIPINQEEYTRV